MAWLLEDKHLYLFWFGFREIAFPQQQ